MSECIRNDYGVLAVSNEIRKVLKLLNTEFAWDNNSFSVAYPISSAHDLLDKGTVRESISKMKNVITSAPPTTHCELPSPFWRGNWTFGKIEKVVQDTAMKQRRDKIEREEIDAFLS